MQLIVLSLLDVCTPPCAHGACVSNNTCFCSEGYQGSSCDIPSITMHYRLLNDKWALLVFHDCDTNICSNGGTCQELAGDYICICAAEYEGINCGM